MDNQLPGQMDFFQCLEEVLKTKGDKCKYIPSDYCNHPCKDKCCWWCKERSSCGKACSTVEYIMKHCESCLNCKHLNRSKSRKTEMKNHLIEYGCEMNETGWIPGAVWKEDADGGLSKISCGMFKRR